jgi:hypothetical protein
MNAEDETYQRALRIWKLMGKYHRENPLKPTFGATVHTHQLLTARISQWLRAWFGEIFR